MKEIVIMSWRASPAEPYQPQSCPSGTSGWKALGPFVSWLLYCFRRVPQKCPSFNSPWSMALGGYLGKWPSKLWSDSPILASPCLCFSCIVSHRRRKRPHATPVSPVPEESISYLFEALICCPWGDVELGRQVTECPSVPQFKLIACLPQGLLHRCHGDQFPGIQASAVDSGSIHHRAVCQVPGWVAIDGIGGFRIWFCPFWGLSSVFFHITKLTPAVSFLGKLVREKVNH